MTPTSSLKEAAESDVWETCFEAGTKAAAEARSEERTASFIFNVFENGRVVSGCARRTRENDFLACQRLFAAQQAKICSTSKW